MTAAAFQATFADFRLVKSRKQAQFVFEVPLELADAALKTLGGLPRPDQEAWVGVARIDPRAASSSNPEGQQKERRPFASLPLAQQAALRCNDEDFWRFINQSCGVQKGVDCVDGAASFVRIHCRVESRSDIKLKTDAGDRWIALNDKFHAWLNYR